MMPHAPPIGAPSPVLRQNWETLARHPFQLSKASDVNTCPHTTFIRSSILRCKPTNRSPLVLRPKPRNYRSDFVGKITNQQLLVLRPKPGNPSTLVLRLNHETCTPHLLVHSADRTQRHSTSQLFGHRVPDLCLTIPGPLHQVSYSCLNAHHCSPCRTCHLHIMRQANTFLHTKQIVGWNHRNFPDSNSNQSKSNTHHKSNLGTNQLVSQSPSG
jgi:hypothetical protein